MVVTCHDPNKPEGRETLIDLVRWADVVTESFSPKGMRGFGLGYDTLQQIKPDLIIETGIAHGGSADSAFCADRGMRSDHRVDHFCAGMDEDWWIDLHALAAGFL